MRWRNELSWRFVDTTGRGPWELGPRRCQHKEKFLALYKEWEQSQGSEGARRQGWNSKSRRQGGEKGHGGGKSPDKELRRPKGEIWELQRVLEGKKSSLCKTYKNQAEANDKIWLLNENTDKALGMLATSHERFEATN